MILSVDIRKKSFPSTQGAGEHVVLADLRFTLGEREIVALVGPSGCGKTTLLKLIGGLDTHYDGEIVWHGAGREAPLIRVTQTGGQRPPGHPKIGTVFQEPRLLPWRTVRQNIDLVLPRGGDSASVRDLLETLDLWPFRDAFPAQLSLGMARRVAIARAFAIAPEIVLLDEPFVSLDSAMAERSRGVLLAAWNRQPTAALLVTHDLVEAASLADRILILSPSPARPIADIAVPDDIKRAGGDAAIRFAEQLRRVAAKHAAATAPPAGGGAEHC